MNTTIEGKRIVVREEYINDNSLLEFIKFSKYPDITPAFVKYIDKSQPGNPIKEDLVGEINLFESITEENDGITTITSKDNEHIIEYNNKAVAHYINIKNNKPSLFLLSVYNVETHQMASFELKDVIYKELFKKESKVKEKTK